MTPLEQLEYRIFKHNGSSWLLDFHSGFLLPLHHDLTRMFTVMEQSGVADFPLLRRLFPETRYQQMISELEELTEKGFLRKKPASVGQFHALRLHLTQRCNLNCDYCFQDKTHKGDMTAATARNAVDFLLEYSPHNQLKIIFFGGEPLLCFPMMREITAYAAKRAGALPGKEIRFAVSTNGLLLDDTVLDMLVETDAGVSVSYDGVGQGRRRWGNEKISLPTEQLLRQIHRLRERLDPRRLALAAVIHHGNKDIPGILRELIKTGVSHLKLTFETSARPDVALSAEDYQEIAGQTEEALDIMMENGAIRADYYTLSAAPSGALPYHTACVACHEEITVNYNGDLFPCSFFTNKENFRLGNINDGVFHIHRYEQARRALDRSRNGCRQCPDRRICSGHCPYESVTAGLEPENPTPLKCHLFQTINAAKIRRFISRVYENQQNEYPISANEINMLTGGGYP